MYRISSQLVLWSLYKILANVLTNKLKRVIGKVVSNNQNAIGGVDKF